LVDLDFLCLILIEIHVQFDCLHYHQLAFQLIVLVMMLMKMSLLHMI